MQAIVPGEVPVRNLGKPSRGEPKFSKGQQNRDNSMYLACFIT